MTVQIPNAVPPVAVVSTIRPNDSKLFSDMALALLPTLHLRLV